MQSHNQNKLAAVMIFSLALSLTVSAQEKGSKKKSAAPGLTKEYLQKIWNGWAALNPAEQAQYYARGAHVFFDIAPVKYNNWEEYQTGVTKVLADYKAAKFIVNDDAETHPAGDIVWVTATIASDMTEKSGKRDLSTMRWTAIFERREGKWLMIHEHVSEPLQ